MKKMIGLVICFALISVAAFAGQTGKTTWNALPEFAQTVFEHSQEYSQTSKYKAPLGYGIDLTLYEMDIANVGVGIGVDSTYDQNNGVFGCMAKVRVNTTQLINKLIGK